MTNIESENWRAWFGWIIMEDDKRWIDELSQDGKSDRKCAGFLMKESIIMIMLRSIYALLFSLT